MAKILYIDDEELIRLPACDYLEDQGHEVHAAATGREGLEMWRELRPDIVLSDLRMPDGDGFYVVRSLAAQSPETPVVIISGTGSVSEAVASMRLGAWDYLTKPVRDMQVLSDMVDSMLAKARSRRLTALHKQLLERQNKKLAAEVERWTEAHAQTLDRLEQTLSMSIRSLAQTVKEKDPYTAGHNERVARIAVSLGTVLGMDSDQRESLFTAGILHDIGKIGVPEAILNKPSALDSDEYEQIKTHVACGHRILADIPFRGPVAEIVLQHHERFDGSGYPSGFVASEIRPEARVLAVADVFEALSSKRPYREAMPQEQAWDYIREHSGKLFCPWCVAALRVVLDRSFEQERKA